MKLNDAWRPRMAILASNGGCKQPICNRRIAARWTQGGADFLLWLRAMHVRSGSIVATVSLCLAWLAGGAVVQAQTIQVPVEDIALRNGESVEFGDVYLIGRNCRSLLTSEPEVEVMDGPPGVVVAIRRAMVVPYGDGCGSSVLGGRMSITARDIDEYSYSRMVLRITYKTRSGNLQRSQHINVTLFP